VLIMVYTAIKGLFAPFVHAFFLERLYTIVRSKC
jgi:hypothetical protein